MSESEISASGLVDAMTRTLTAPAFVLNDAGEFVGILSNARTDGLLYGDRSSLVGKSLFEVFPERRAEEFHEVVERVLDRRSVQEYEYRLPVERGVRYFIGHVAPVPGDESKVLWIAEDVTERERRRRELELALDVGDMGAWTFDLETGEFVARTNHVDRIYGHDEPVDWGIEQFKERVHPDDRARVEAEIARAKETGRLDTECRIGRTDDAERWIRVRGEFFYSSDGDPVLLRGVTQDVTDRKEQEHDLELFRTLVDESSDSIVIADADTGNVVDVNETACETYGYDRDDFLEMNVGDLNATIDGPDGFWEVLGDHGTDDVAPFETEHERADGSRVPVEVSVSRVDVGGRAYGVAIVRDITERTRLQAEQRRQYQHLVRTEGLANTGGWEYVPSTDTVRWTEGTYGIFEVPQEYVPALDSVFDFFVPRDRHRLQEAFLQCLEDGDPYDVDVQIVTNRGRHRWIRVRGARIVDGDVTKVAGVVQDITEQKLDEQRLMVLNRILRHNLRNKLTLILGYAERIQDEIPPAERKFLDVLESSTESLLSLANKSRRFNHVVEYDFTAGMTAIAPTVEEVCAEYREAYPDATIVTDCADVAVPANETEIRILVDELVENAAKHTDKPGPAVSVSVTQQGESHATITVADDGPGLPESERAVLQTGKETQLLHSDGIGLWIVNWIVMKRGGGVSVASNSPRGTIITVTLPAEEPNRSGV